MSPITTKQIHVERVKAMCREKAVQEYLAKINHYSRREKRVNEK